MSRPKSFAAACLVAAALISGTPPAAEAQSLTFSRGDVFTSSVHEYHLMFLEIDDETRGGFYYVFIGVDPTGTWLPGMPREVWIDAEDLAELLTSGKIAPANPGGDPPGDTTLPTGTTTPEPVSMLLLATGLAGVGGVGALQRRRRRAR